MENNDMSFEVLSVDTMIEALLANGFLVEEVLEVLFVAGATVQEAVKLGFDRGDAERAYQRYKGW